MSTFAQVITATAETHGCTVELRWGDVAYGPTINARPMVARVEAAAQGMGNGVRWLHMEEPTMAGEDFSFMAGAYRLPAASCVTSISNEPGMQFWAPWFSASVHTVKR